MTRVNAAPGGPGWNPAGEDPPQGPSARSGAQRGDAGGEGLGTGFRFGQAHHSAHSFGDREEAFSEKMRLELQKDAAAGEETPPHLLRLLAVAEALPLPLSGPLAGPPEIAGTQPARQDRIAAVADRIEQALKAGRVAAAGDGSPGLRLSIPDPGGDISAVTLTMDAQTIEVVLTPAGPGSDNDILAAAQSLAERLQARFSRRTVRILEAPAAQGAEPGGMDEISRLLGRRETTR